MALLRAVVISKIILMLFFIRLNETKEREETEEEDISFLSELPLQQLLAQKKSLPTELKLFQDQQPVALPLIDESRPKVIGLKGFHKDLPVRKTFHEDDYEHDKDLWMHKKPEKHHSHDILNTSLTVLSYLAFGGYLLCMIVNSLRQNNRSLMATMSSMPAMPAPMTTLLQQYSTRRPIRIKFPAVTVNHGKRRRRKRSLSRQRANSRRQSQENLLLINPIEYVEALSQIFGAGN